LSDDFVSPVSVQRTFSVVEPLVDLVIVHDGRPGSESVTFTVNVAHQLSSGADAVLVTLVHAYSGLIDLRITHCCNRSFVVPRLTSPR
jgi:hypothetical protein